MTLSKAAGIFSVRKMMKEKGPKFEAAFLEKLDADTARIYRKAMTASWVSTDALTQIYEASAFLLWPNRNDSLRELGRIIARREMGGFSRMLARWTAADYIVGQAGKLWQTYHRDGNAYAVKTRNANETVFIVENFPELPESFRELLCGYIQYMAEVSGAKNVRVTREDDTPHAWHWLIHYD